MSDSVSSVNQRFRRQALLWFLTAAVMAALWLFLWLFVSAPTAAKERQKTQATAEDFALPTTIEQLNELNKEVQPIDFATVVRDLRNYPAEFKDKKFFEQNAKRWTVQVMDVAQNEIITEYLKGRSDRENFAYFRYHNSNNELRYILTYGVMGSMQEALGAIRTLDFGLPKSVEPMPEEMKRYIDLIDNYERTEPAVAATVQPAVRLEKARRETPAVPATKEQLKQAQPKAPVVADEVVADLSVAEDPPNTEQPAPKQPKLAPTATPKNTAETEAPPTTKPKPAPATDSVVEYGVMEPPTSNTSSGTGTQGNK